MDLDHNLITHDDSTCEKIEMLCSSSRQVWNKQLEPPQSAARNIETCISIREAPFRSRFIFPQRREHSSFAIGITRLKIQLSPG